LESRALYKLKQCVGSHGLDAYADLLRWKSLRQYHLNGCHVGLEWFSSATSIDFQFLVGGDHAFLLAQVKFMLQCSNVAVQKSIIFVLWITRIFLSIVVNNCFIVLWK
jgi:hypothetical protein